MFFLNSCPMVISLLIESILLPIDRNLFFTLLLILDIFRNGLIKFLMIVIIIFKPDGLVPRNRKKYTFKDAEKTAETGGKL